LKPRERTPLEIVDTHLQDVVSHLPQNIADADIPLTPQERPIAVLIKDGHGSMEIAEDLIIQEPALNFSR